VLICVIYSVTGAELSRKTLIMLNNLKRSVGDNTLFGV
jgi:hypothetical protein